MSKHSKQKQLIGAVIAVTALIIVICAAYVNDYYRADKDAIAAFTPVSISTKQVLENDTLAYIPENPRAGFIFYPGGKVEFSAYEPLMDACTEEGILCVLVKMPFHLAVLDKNAADGIQDQFPEIEHWFIGGHSLGGAMAASYLSEHIDVFDGLILLGSYSASDLSDDPISALSVYGSEDMVLNREKYEENLSNLPADFEELVIEGGCHAYFGMYGPQDGDGIPAISNEEQIAATASAISGFIFK